MMGKRPKTTKFLNDILIHQRLNKRSVYWASEVTLDYSTSHPKRVDFMEFQPVNQSVSGLEKGIFICYEVKSCKEDFHSGNGLNFEGDKNYIVTTMECYKDIVNEIPYYVGVMVPVEYGRDKIEEFENPTVIPDEYKGNLYGWELKIIKNATTIDRKRSIVELMFCMLRSGKCDKCLRG